ncbi:MAG: HNH endonuclease [bacterium]
MVTKSDNVMVKSDNGEMMSDWVHIEKNQRHIAREKAKARELRKSQWWKNKIAAGLCAYCHKRFPSQELTMDHIVPLARGGRSTKGNVVPSCKRCNIEKKYYTRAEMIMDELNDTSPEPPDEPPEPVEPPKPPGSLEPLDPPESPGPPEHPEPTASTASPDPAAPAGSIEHSPSKK